MPTNKNAIYRYKILDELLADRNHYYSMQDLVSICKGRLERAGYVPVSRRCIEKDIEYLQEELEKLAFQYSS